MGAMSLFEKIGKLLGIGPAPSQSPARSDELHADQHAPSQDTASKGAPRVDASRDVAASDEAPRGRSGRRRWVTASDDRKIETRARSLVEGGDADGAFALLRAETSLFAGHEPARCLPCLCAACLDPRLNRAHSQGVDFVRDFVVTRRHSLVFWAPAEIADDAKHLRASMRAELRHRLRVRARKSDEPREVVNPFTKEKTTVLPREARRRRTNPFTGEPVP
jgi:hypothetical protein